MYSNNIENFQESTTILNACTKKSGSLLNAPRLHLLDDNKTYEQISPQTIFKMCIILMFYKKLITKEDKFWFTFINYHPTIPKINGLPKPHKL